MEHHHGFGLFFLLSPLTSGFSYTCICIKFVGVMLVLLESSRFNYFSLFHSVTKFLFCKIVFLFFLLILLSDLCTHLLPLCSVITHFSISHLLPRDLSSVLLNILPLRHMAKINAAVHNLVFERAAAQSQTSGSAGPEHNHILLFESVLLQTTQGFLDLEAGA